MKTRKQKVISILACVFLLASFFAIPVSAADDVYKVTFEYPDPTIIDQLQYIAGITSTETYLTNGPYWNFYNPVSASATADYGQFRFTVPDGFDTDVYVGAYVGRSKFDLSTYSTSDTVWIDPCKVDFRIFGGSTLYAFRFSLRQFTDDVTITNVVGHSDWTIVNLYSSNDLQSVSVPQTAINMIQGGDFYGLGLFIDMYFYQPTPTFYFGIGYNSVTVNYSQILTPNTPIYPPPDSGDLGNLESAEGQLMDSNTAGLDAANNAFLSFADNLVSFGLVFTRISMMLNRFVNGVPLVSVLVWISLSLGLFASLLGLAGAIVGAADRKAGREAARAARSKK